MTKLILIAGTTALIMIGLFIAFISVSSPQNSLDRFLKEVSNVDLGKTRLEDWHRHVEQLHLSNLTLICASSTCVITWSGKNTILSKLHLAPQTVAESSVRFRDGVADQIYLALVIQGRDEKKNWYDERGVVVRQTTDVPSACHQRYDLSVKQRYRAGERFWATITMDRCVIPEDRAKAFALNTKCLTTLGGCKTIETFLPKVFGDLENSGQVVHPSCLVSSRRVAPSFAQKRGFVFCARSKAWDYNNSVLKPEHFHLLHEQALLRRPWPSPCRYSSRRCPGVHESAKSRRYCPGAFIPGVAYPRHSTFIDAHDCPGSSALPHQNEE